MTAHRFNNSPPGTKAWEGGLEEERNSLIHSWLLRAVFLYTKTHSILDHAIWVSKLLTAWSAAGQWCWCAQIKVQFVCSLFFMCACCNISNQTVNLSKPFHNVTVLSRYLFLWGFFCCCCNYINNFKFITYCIFMLKTANNCFLVNGLF